MLKPGENAWQFEKDGNLRNKTFDFYSVYDTELVSYHHGIVKGKWLPKTLNYLKANGYVLNENTFEKHSKFQVFNLKIYTMIFYVVQKFLHIFK